MLQSKGRVSKPRLLCLGTYTVGMLQLGSYRDPSNALLRPGLLVQLPAHFFLAFFILSFDFSTLLSSSSPLPLLSPACTVQARSPLESSVPCLATRTLDDEIRVQRSPSMGWLSKSTGRGRGRGGWARGEERKRKGNSRQPGS